MGYEEYKKKTACLCYLSILLFVAGLCILGSVAGIAGVASISSGQGVDPTALMKQVGSALLVICGLAVIGLGVQGMMVSRCKARCFIMLFGCGLGTIALILFIIGCVFSSTASWFPGAMTQLCAPKANDNGSSYTTASSMDTGMLQLVNENMCTDTCPCDSTAYNQGYGSMPAGNFTYQGRTSAKGSGKNANGQLQITLAAGGAQSFQRFSDCWKNVMAPKEQDQQKLGQVNSYLGVMAGLEPKFGCSGMCTNALFFFTQPISSSPAGGCQNAIVSTVGNGYTIPGAIVIISSFLVLIIFLFQYCLWCEKPEDDQWNN